MQRKNIISVDIHDTIQKAKQGDGNAQNDLANFYTFGFGVEISYEKAELLYKKAIKNGCQDAKINLATIYHELGKIEEWEEILEELSESGDKVAMYNLSAVYLENPKKRDKGIEMLDKLVLEGYDIAAITLGNYYLYTVKDVKKACEYFKQCKNIYDLNITEYYLGYENMIDIDIEEATKVSNYLLNKGYLGEKYNADILNSLNGKEILKAKSFKEIHDMEIDENIYGAVAVNGDLYSISDYQKVKHRINEFLLDVEENNGTNEFDIFMKIYLKIISEIRYDYSVTRDSEDSVSKIKNLYTHRNLIGALVDKNCVCAGYAKALRELAEFRDIDSINIENDEHTHLFNQVKINGKWYYADVTFDYSNVQSGNELSNCLVSKNSFPKCSSHEDNNSNVYEAREDYSRDIVKEYFENFKKQYLIDEYRNNSMFRFPFLSDIIEKFKQGKFGKKIIDFLDR